MWRWIGIAMCLIGAGAILMSGSRRSSVQASRGSRSPGAAYKTQKLTAVSLPAAIAPAVASASKSFTIDLSFKSLLAEAPSWTGHLDRLFPSDPQVARAWEQCMANYQKNEPKCAKVLEVTTALLSWHKQNGQFNAEEADFVAKMNLFECQREASITEHRKSCEVSVELIQDSRLAAAVGAGMAEVCRTQDAGVCFGAAQLMTDDKLKNSYIKYGCQKGDASACDSYAMTAGDLDLAGEKALLNACHDGRTLGCTRVLSSVANLDESQAQTAAAQVGDMVSQCVRAQNSSACQALVAAGYSSYLNPTTQSEVLSASCSNLDLQSCETLWRGQGIAQVQQISNREELCAKYVNNRPAHIGSDEVCRDGFCYSQSTQKFFGQLCNI